MKFYVNKCYELLTHFQTCGIPNQFAKLHQKRLKQKKINYNKEKFDWTKLKNKTPNNLIKIKYYALFCNIRNKQCDFWQFQIKGAAGESLIADFCRVGWLHYIIIN